MEGNFLRKNILIYPSRYPIISNYSFSARVVSVAAVRADVEVFSETDTIFVMNFGQVIDHGSKI